MSVTKKGLKTKARILGCAKELYYQRGFNQTTIQEIANLSGSTLGSMTYHFSTKADFVRTVFSDYVDAINTMLEETHPEFTHFNPLQRVLLSKYVFFKNIMMDEKIESFYMEILHSPGYYDVVKEVVRADYFAFLGSAPEPTVSATMYSDFGARFSFFDGYSTGFIKMDPEEAIRFTIMCTARLSGINDEITESALDSAYEFYKDNSDRIQEVKLIS